MGRGRGEGQRGRKIENLRGGKREEARRGKKEKRWRQRGDTWG